MNPSPFAAVRGDQAAGLRRLFGAPAAALLPVLATAPPDEALASWIARLALAFARSGRRTGVIDAVRGQLAARLGLRARHDLQQVLDGACTPAAAVARGTDLWVLPAARAFGRAPAGARLAGLLAPAVAGELAALDLLVVVLAPAHAGLLAPQPALDRPPDVLVPLSTLDAPSAPAGASVPSAPVRRAVAAGTDPLDAVVARLARFAGRAEIGVFRLLFPGTPEDAVGTLVSRMTASVRRSAVPCEIPTTPALAAARDPARIAAAVAGWTLPSLRIEVPARHRSPQTVERFR